MSGQNQWQFQQTASTAPPMHKRNTTKSEMCPKGSTSGSTPLAITVTVLCAVGIVAAISYYGKKDSDPDSFETADQDPRHEERQERRDSPPTQKVSTSQIAATDDGRSDRTSNARSVGDASKSDRRTASGDRQESVTETQKSPVPNHTTSDPKNTRPDSSNSTAAAKSNPTVVTETDPENLRAQGDHSASVPERAITRSTQTSIRPAQPSKGSTQPARPTTKPPTPKFASDFVKSAYAKQFHDLLHEGWKRGRRSLETATKRFKAARGLQANDPRLYYAYGLVLAKHERRTEALQQFDAACKKANYPYLPAWRALAWWRADGGQTQAALDDLERLAKQIEESDSAWPDDFAKRNTATWVGRMLGYLLGPGISSTDSPEIVKRKAAAIRELTSANRAAFVENGIARVLKQFRELQESDTSQPRNKSDAGISKQNALSTYVPFDLEEQRTQLLKSFP